MSLYRLERELHLPIALEEAWDFFSSPRNLDLITPQKLSFNILTELPEEMYAGMIIEYRLQLFGAIPSSWVTEITQVKHQHFFVDEQRKGPYSFWHHEHHFERTQTGTRMRDLLHYSLPFGIMGKWVHSAFIKKQVHDIFDYREYALNKIFLDNPIAL